MVASEIFCCNNRLISSDGSIAQVQVAVCLLTFTELTQATILFRRLIDFGELSHDGPV